MNYINGWYRTAWFARSVVSHQMYDSVAVHVTSVAVIQIWLNISEVIGSHVSSLVRDQIEEIQIKRLYP